MDIHFGIAARDCPKGIPSAEGIPPEGASRVIHIQSLRDFRPIIRTQNV